MNVTIKEEDAAWRCVCGTLNGGFVLEDSVCRGCRTEVKYPNQCPQFVLVRFHITKAKQVL